MTGLLYTEFVKSTSSSSLLFSSLRRWGRRSGPKRCPWL